MGMERFLFVGLGNPGEKFMGTRHNVGVDALRAWVQQWGDGAAWRQQSRFESEIASVTRGGMTVDCMFPLTFMNDSGRAVQAYSQFYDIAPEDILIIHDELELPLGEIGIKEGGSAHGHNGVRSIHDVLGTDQLVRLRIGVGRPVDDVPVERYVLQRFTEDERTIIQTRSIPQACDMLETILQKAVS